MVLGVYWVVLTFYRKVLNEVNVLDLFRYWSFLMVCDFGDWEFLNG